jgi:lysozyme family protein
VTDFDRIFAKTMTYEVGGKPNGGYRNDDPEDPGGETKYGIAKKFHPQVDIKNLTQYLAEAIYREQYYPHVADLKDITVQWKVFDFAVNFGRHEAIVTLQSIVSVPQDGVLGPQTAEAANAVKPAILVSMLATRMCDLHLADIRKHPEKHKYWNGWLRRSNDLGEGL